MVFSTAALMKRTGLRLVDLPANVFRRSSFALLTRLGFLRDTAPWWANFLHPLTNLNILAGADLQFGAEC
jgi:hypothetical protein